MPELSGLELAGLIGQRTRVVFTTAHRAYGPEAFDRDAADYLVKPIFYARFLQALEKVRRLLAPDTGSTLFVKTGVKGQAVGILPTEICYAKAALNYLDIFTAEKRIVTYLTLGELLEKLPAGQFSRIHKSHLVNHDAIQTLEYGRVKLKDGTVLPVGRLYRADFRKKMNALVLTSKRDHPA
jgi:DNA-binding LytR/AlgR family response regulator